MRIIFIGSSKSSKALLEKSINLKLNVVGICTLKKSLNYDFYDLKKTFSESNIPKYYSKDINSKLSYNWIKNKRPDIIFCFGWSQLLKKKIYSLAKIATVGFHPSELPKNRGRHPIIWSLALGLKKTASSFFLIDSEKPDTGKIISQKIIRIKENDTAKTLYRKIINQSLKQLPKIIDIFKKNKKIKNNKLVKSSYWRKRNYDDGKVDWRMSAKKIYDLSRALAKPYMHSHFIVNKKEVKILSCKIKNKKNTNININFEPGKILLKRKKFFDVKCGEGVIRILKTNKKIKLNNINYL